MQNKKNETCSFFLGWGGAGEVWPKKIIFFLLNKKGGMGGGVKPKNPLLIGPS